jgi:iron-sulfur cluster repair protein YtfE (RIC family)
MSDQYTQQDVGDVNQAIRQEHEQLRALLGEIGQVLTTRHVPIDAVVRKLSLLRDQLELHFRHEESEGFFEQIADQAPRLAGRIAKLCVEHLAMLREIDVLLEQAMQGDSSEGWWRFTGAAFHDLSKRLMEHEREENELLQRTYTDDIGSKD